HPELVCSTSQRQRAHEGEIALRRDELEPRATPSPSCLAAGAQLEERMTRMRHAAEDARDLPLRSALIRSPCRCWRRPRHGEVLLAHLVPRELAADLCRDGGAPREEDHAGG